ncbi:hypothetical protein ILP31_19535 [Pectobacterium punjabense]|nr:hypothetical protein [Pectobacterium punjabense]MBT9186281.1 hypothetical protein [Pectobacterium punjabense]
MDIQYWKHKDGWIYIGNEMEGARPATDEEIKTHQRTVHLPDVVSHAINS